MAAYLSSSWVSANPRFSSLSQLRTTARSSSSPTRSVRKASYEILKTIRVGLQIEDCVSVFLIQSSAFLHNGSYFGLAFWLSGGGGTCGSATIRIGNGPCRQPEGMVSTLASSYRLWSIQSMYTGRWCLAPDALLSGAAAKPVR
ncbi:hypothetical protein KC330_g130 [Hortaea werneckii]|nr:hypothetical protein KC330_g130 [Hortaea werneckii]